MNVPFWQWLAYRWPCQTAHALERIPHISPTVLDLCSRPSLLPCFATLKTALFGSSDQAPLPLLHPLTQEYKHQENTEGIITLHSLIIQSLTIARLQTTRSELLWKLLIWSLLFRVMIFGLLMGWLNWPIQKTVGHNTNADKKKWHDCMPWLCKSVSLFFFYVCVCVCVLFISSGQYSINTKNYWK